MTELRLLPGAVAAQAAPAEAPPSTQVSHDDVRPGLELARLIADATRADGHAPFGEHVLLTLGQPAAGQPRAHRQPGRRPAGRLSGAVRHAGRAWYAELVTAPAYRSRGVAASLLSAARGHVAGHGGGCLRTWAYTHGAPDALADKLGMDIRRQVRYQQRPLTAPPAPGAVPGVRLRTLRRDEAGAWLALSNAAFDGHPENGGWTADDLGWRLAAPWTSLDRFVVAVDAGTDELLAGVWTKVESGSTEGELYVVAVRPDQAGRGLGRLVVRHALQVLAAHGLATASLYVDSTNTAALALYASAGFGTRHTDRCFELTVPPAR